jgi:hypothetical protein
MANRAGDRIAAEIVLRRRCADEERLNRAAQAGYRVVRDSLTVWRADIVRQLAKLPRDGLASDLGVG